jgi:PIN domain nuclease of toxin-antitoxin system
MVKKTSEASVVYLVRVTTDDRVHQLWVASASSYEEAITLVLNRVPEGWAAALLSNKLKPIEITALNLKPGEAKEITRVSAIAGSSATLPPTKH